MKQTGVIPMWEITEDNRTLRIVFKRQVNDKEVNDLKNRLKGIDDLLSTLKLLFQCEKNSQSPNPSILGLLEKTIQLYE